MTDNTTSGSPTAGAWRDEASGSTHPDAAPARARPGLESPTAERQIAELQQREERYKRLLASASDYAFTVTVESGRSVATSHGPACLTVTGYAPEEFEAEPELWYRIIHEADRPSVLAQVNRILKGDAPPPLEHRIIHKDGCIRWIRNVSVPHKDQQGRVVAYDGLISDITKRKHAEEVLTKTLADLKASHEALKTTQLELIQSAKMETLGKLAAGVAHEVKNPLQTLLMGLDYLSNNPGTASEDLTRILSDMRDAVRRADSIICELLQLSAASHIAMPPEDLNNVVERSLWLINHELSAAHITVIRDLAPNLPLVGLDKMKMEQVFINLFINALQAMPKGGTLTLRTRAGRWRNNASATRRTAEPFQPGDAVVVAEVQDTGVGIPKENLARIFDPFFTTKPVGVGTGLGLSVVKTIIDLHGAVIDIQNAPQGGVLVTLALKAP
jgi:PAS domain S-box-containing protein